MNSGLQARLPDFRARPRDSEARPVGSDYRIPARIPGFWLGFPDSRLGFPDLSVYSKVLSMCRCHVFVDYMLAFFVVYI